MVRRGVALLGLAMALVVVGCGGDGGGGAVLAPGAVVVQRTGGQATVSGRVAFENAAGAAINGPAGGVLVVVGAASKAVGTNARGEFSGVQVGAALGQAFAVPVYALLPGWLPGMVTVDVGVDSLPADSLACIMDQDRIDDPVIENPTTTVGDDGLCRLKGTIPNMDTQVKAYALPVAPSQRPDPVLPTTPVNVLPVQYTPAGPGLQEFEATLTTAQDPALVSGSYHAFAFKPAQGADVLPLASCDMDLTDYSRDGARIRGTVTAPDGPAAQAHVIVWDMANPDGNNAEGDTDGQGAFDVNLPSEPVGRVLMEVHYVDGDGQVHVCTFDRAP